MTVGVELPLSDVSVSSCCPDGLATPLDRDTAEQLAKLLKAVADPARLQLLALLKSSPNGSSCVCDLTGPLGLSQPTVSHHLKVLRESGWVTSQRRGTFVWYRIRPEAVSRLRTIAGELSPIAAAPAPGRVLPVVQPQA